MTVLELLRRHPLARTAAVDPTRGAVSYATLLDNADHIAVRLAGLGATPAMTVASVLPNGLSSAVIYLGTLGVARAAPLNPKLTPRELLEGLVGVGAHVVVTTPERAGELEGLGTQARVVAVEWAESRFDLIGGGITEGAPGEVGADDAALALMTSGTTGSPKRVSLTQANLVHALEGIVATLGLDESDCGLLMMPQFHIHGLQAGLLAPLVAGGRVVLPSGFDALSVARLCVEHRVTWYTAVPTMHRLIVDRAGRSDGSWIEPIRFVRSSSSAMPTTLAGLIEDLVEAPLIEAYGMTECAHQITSNQLPPQQRVIGTVGLPTGVEIRIDDERDDGRGEVMVRGPSVMSGYESAGPGVNAKAFSDGWLRTGDEGTMDGEGRLTLTGRLTEIINRGGEKVRPQEVEQVLSEHPDVVEVAVFAVPHPRLGEDVAAAVVTTGAEITPQDVRNHARGGLAAFKVPRQVLIVDQIPRGPTGKVQRSILAAQLGLS